VSNGHYLHELSSRPNIPHCCLYLNNSTHLDTLEITIPAPSKTASDKGLYLSCSLIVHFSVIFVSDFVDEISFIVYSKSGSGVVEAFDFATRKATEVPFGSVSHFYTIVISSP